MTEFQLKRTACSLAVILALVSMSNVQANDEAEASVTATEKNSDEKNVAANDDAEVLLITATKRETNIMKTPLAVSAISQRELQRQNVVDARDLAGKIPNLQIAAGADSGSATTIRGVTSTDFTEVGEGSVSYHIDGAYSPRPQGALALMHDLERVEVLRGPQGTLFGMNSPGGSINIIPHKPEFSDFYHSADVELGNYHHQQLRAMTNLGVSDAFAIRATMMIERRDGMMQQEQDFTDIASPANGIALDGIPDVDQRRNKRVSKADYYNNSDVWATRVIALWQTTEKLKSTLTIEHFSDNGAGDLMFVDCKQAAGTPGACDHTLRYAKVNVPGKKDLDIDDVRLNLVYALSDDTSLDYRYSYQDQTRYQIEDADGGVHAPSAWSDIGEAITHESELTGYYPISDESWETKHSRYETTIHELQIKSNADSPFNYVAGLFHLKEEKSIRYDMEMLTNKSYVNDPSQPLGFIPDGLPDSWVFDQNRRTTESKALFAQIDYKFNDAFALTLGARHTEDRKTDGGGITYAYWQGDVGWYNGEHTPNSIRAHQSNDLTWNMGSNATGGPVMPASEPNFQDRSWQKNTYRLGGQYYVDDKQMLFASVATGYKMGGMYELADFCNNGCLNLLTYDPETVTTYEIGYKGTLFDGDLRLNITAFFSDYDDMQITGDIVVGIDENPTSPNVGEPVSAWTTDNLSTAKIKGLEVEYVWFPWENGRISGYLAYLNTEITDNERYTAAYACAEREIYGQPLCGDAKSDHLIGNELPFAPPLSLSINYTHTLYLANGFQLEPNIAMRWQDDMWLDIANYDGDHLSQKQEAYAKFDASIRLSEANDAYYVELSGSNLSNEDTKNFTGFRSGRVLGSYDPPRQYFLKFGVSF